LVAVTVFETCIFLTSNEDELEKAVGGEDEDDESNSNMEPKSSRKNKKGKEQKDDPLEEDTVPEVSDAEAKEACEMETVESTVEHKKDEDSDSKVKDSEPKEKDSEPKEMVSTTKSAEIESNHRDEGATIDEDTSMEVEKPEEKECVGDAEHLTAEADSKIDEDKKHAEDPTMELDEQKHSEGKPDEEMKDTEGTPVDETKDDEESKLEEVGKECHLEPTSTVPEEYVEGRLPWPTTTDLNTRIRKLITAFQRFFKKEESKNAAKAKRQEKREKIEQMVRERERQKLEVLQKRWSKKEESDFCKTISTYGVIR
jgi:hypothetical protein